MNFVATLDFEKQFKRLHKKYPSLPADLTKLFEMLEADPFTGTPLGNNCFKIRLAIASKGRGKSGGGRVITYVRIVLDTVYLATIYDKSEIENVPVAEVLDALKRLGIFSEN